jgi:hypothetical protein
MTTDENGLEIGPRLQPVVERLLAWQRDVASQVCTDPQSEAERISLANRIDTAIRLLRLCDEHHVSPGANWDSVPDLISPSYMPEIRVVDDGETDDPAGWRELEFRSGVAVRLHSGSVVIGGHHTKPVPGGHRID